MLERDNTASYLLLQTVKGFISFKEACKNISEHLAYSEIWDSHGDEYEDYSLLVCDAV